MTLQTPILITGASGFVGANLLRRLIEEMPSQKVHVLLRKSSNTWRIDDALKKVSTHVVDLQDQLKINRLVQKIKPRTIFHLAAHGAYPYQQLGEKEIIDTNVICTFNLIQACLRTGFNAFINTGSSSEYGINQKPMSEGDLLTPITAYGVSKAWATLYGQYLALAQKVPITTLRLFGVYGFYEPLGRLVPNIILSLLKKEQPTLIASHFARDFVFVDDVVDAYLSAAENCSQLIPRSGIVPQFIFNIGSGRQTTLKEIFYFIKDIIRIDIEPIWDNHANHSFDTDRRIADIEMAKIHLGWEPKTNLDNGLQQTVDWFKKNISLYK